MQDKWNVKNKKGYLKIHVAVNIKTKEIIALEVTDEKVHDGKVMKQLIEQVLNNNHDIKIKSFIGDAGAYDNMRISNIFKRKGLKYHQSKKELYYFNHENNKIRNREVDSNKGLS